MKEEEAKTKICPMFKLQKDDQYLLCYGSACMMWQPNQHDVTNQDGYCGFKQPESRYE